MQWNNLEQYKQSEFDYCLKLARGQSKEAHDFYARYALALCTHQLYGDAASLVVECTEPEFSGVKTLVQAMANSELPPQGLEFPTDLDGIAQETATTFRKHRAKIMHQSYRKVPVDYAESIVGDTAVLEGLYELRDGMFVGIYSPVATNDVNEIELLTQASNELQAELNQPRMRRRDQMEVE